MGFNVVYISRTCFPDALGKMEMPGVTVPLLVMMTMMLVAASVAYSEVVGPEFSKDGKPYKYTHGLKKRNTCIIGSSSQRYRTFQKKKKKKKKKKKYLFN